MTVKVNPDHLQNEISLRLGRDLPSIKISCKSICNFLRHDKANQTDRLMSALAEIIKCREDWRFEKWLLTRSTVRLKVNERNVRQTLKLTSGFKEDNGFRHSVLTAKPCTSTSEAVCRPIILGESQVVPTDAENTRRRR